jgi:predicted dienelactone hydrolase
MLTATAATHCCDVTRAAEPGYDPLSIPEARLAEPQMFAVKDVERSREIPLRVFLPQMKAPAPVVLFSHGLGGSRQNNSYLGRHWSARGFAVVFMQHPGSDESIWRGVRPLERLAAMKRAASLENFRLRAKDVAVVLDQLQKWNAETGQSLAGRLDMSHMGMSGHSFGAVTTQAVSGQGFVRGRASFVDERIQAALMFSPSGPRDGADPAKSFGQVRIPWMLMTGTKDVALIGDVDVESRQSVFPALPPDRKYELVLDKAEHSAFNERALPGDREKRNPNHHRVILALSTAFWDAYLREDANAKAWLEGDGPRKLLEPADRWQTK